MTVLGKILVFVNLVFSLLTAGLIVMVFTTRVNWYKAANDQKAATMVARADEQAAQQALTEEKQKRESAYQTLLGEKQKLEAEVTTLKADVVRAKDENKRAADASTSGSKHLEELVKELERRKTEVEGLKKLVDERDKKIADIDRRMAQLRDESVQYRIQWDQTKERLTIQQQQNESLVQDNANLRRQLGGGQAVPTTASTGPTPRAEDLRGTIQRVDGDLATMTPGSDAGVVIGSELYIYRLQPKPEYLGKLVILNVTPTEAVGRLVGSKRGQVKKGDEVAANIMSR